MSYHDAAFDEQNPFPGELYNKYEGVNWYTGCNVDYNGNDVNLNNFLSIMKGDKTSVKLRENSNSTGRVLESD